MKEMITRIVMINLKNNMAGGVVVLLAAMVVVTDYMVFFERASLPQA